MTVFPHCKINIGLQVLNRREDGFHNLETIFYPIPLYDVLELIRTDSSTAFNIEYSGQPVPVNGKPNLCEQAYQLLASRYQLPSFAVHLHKAIPMGAGLGGGSSNGAFMLKLINDYFRLQIADEELSNLALELGSDCPYFLKTGAQHAQGRGEKLEQVDLNLAGWQLLIVNPGIHISTAEAFAAITPTVSDKSLKDLIKLPIEQWQGRIINDFERPIAEKFPAIAALIGELKSIGALYTSMTGTGSTAYGLFRPNSEVKYSFPQNYFTRLLTLQ